MANVSCAMLIFLCSVNLFFYTQKQKKMNTEQKNEEKKIVFFIGKQKFETEEAALTVRQILVDFAKVKTEEKSLALKEGNNHPEYTNLDELVQMKSGMHFVLFDKTPTTAS